MASLVKGSFIVGAKRTVFGTYGGKLKNISITELQTLAAKAALTSANVKPESVDSVVVGVVGSHSAVDGSLVARHVLLKSGIPIEKPAYSVNRLCGSGFQSIVNGVHDYIVNGDAGGQIYRKPESSCLSQEIWIYTLSKDPERQFTRCMPSWQVQENDIETGFAQISLTGGVENMSAYPHVLRGLRFGLPLGQSPALEDSLWVGLTDTYCNLPMGLTAEKLGAQYKLTRDEVDEFALRSQTLWKAAQDAGRFNEELVPVPVKVKKDIVNVEVDEHPKPQTTLDSLKKLPTVFKKDGLVTAGSASGICDGAGAVVLASEQALSKNNLQPLARIVAYSVVGVEPSIMGIGPAPAIKAILKITGKSLNDIDLIEINEAFGAQTLACAKELGLDISKLNVDGGAIALGHPLAASGSRIIAHLVYELRRRKAKLGIGSACIGGGQGIALLIEAL